MGGNSRTDSGPPKVYTGGDIGPDPGIVKVEKNRALYRARLTCPATQHARPGVPGLGGPPGTRTVHYLGVLSIVEARVNRQQHLNQARHLLLGQENGLAVLTDDASPLPCRELEACGIAGGHGL